MTTGGINKQASFRDRWAAVGAATAIALGAGGIGIAGATSSTGEKAVFQPINPCRLADTRPAPNTVGARNTPIGADETFVLDGWGNVGNCTLPTGTSALQLNVTAVGASEPTFLRVTPAGAPPDGSSLNPFPGQPPTPNSVTTSLASDGKFSIYNFAGTVQVIVDVVGYYQDHDHDDRYYTESEADQLIADAIAGLQPTLPAPVQDIADIDPDYEDTGGSTYLNIEVDTVDPVVANTIDLVLPDVCPGVDAYDVLLTASGHLHYDSNSGIDAELELEVNDVNDFRANLEIQLHPADSLAPEIPYSRTMLVTLDSGTHKLEWTAEKEYLSSDSFNVRNPIMVAQPIAHRCP